MKVSVFVCVALQFLTGDSKILSESPQPCRKSDPNVKGCLLEGVHRFISYMPTGIPEYKLPPLDPFEVPLYVMNATVDGLLTVDAVVTNVKVLGLSQVTIDDFKLDLENLVGEFDTTFPHIYMSSEAKAAGTVLGVPIEIEAYLKENVTDVKARFTARFKPYKKRGVSYFALESFKVKSRVEHGHIEIIAKNPQDQPLAEFAMNTINEYYTQLLNITNPVYTNAVEDILGSLITQALPFVPAERILID